MLKICPLSLTYQVQCRKTSLVKLVHANILLLSPLSVHSNSPLFHHHAAFNFYNYSSYNVFAFLLVLFVFSFSS